MSASPGSERMRPSAPLWRASPVSRRQDMTDAIRDTPLEPPLDTQLAEARAWMKANNVPEIPLTFGTKVPFPQAFWDDESGTLLRYAQHAKCLNALCVSFAESGVSPEMLAAATATLAQGQDDEARRHLHDALTKARPTVGRLASVIATAVCPAPPMLFRAIVSEPWFDVVSDAADEDAERDDDSSEEGRSSARLDPLAQELARHAEFQRAPSNASREYIARRALGHHGSLDARDLRDICELAYGIYVTDIKPQQDLDLQAKAKEMLAAGEKRVAIANALGITASRLAKLLG